MSRMFSGDTSLSGFFDRRTLPVATARNGMSFAVATRPSRLSSAPTHSTSSPRPWASSRDRSALTAVSAG